MVEQNPFRKFREGLTDMRQRPRGHSAWPGPARAPSLPSLFQSRGGRSQGSLGTRRTSPISCDCFQTKARTSPLGYSHCPWAPSFSPPLFWGPPALFLLLGVGVGLFICVGLASNSQCSCLSFLSTWDNRCYHSWLGRCFSPSLPCWSLKWVKCLPSMALSLGWDLPPWEGCTGRCH